MCRPDETFVTRHALCRGVWLESQPHSPSSSALSRGPTPRVPVDAAWMLGSRPSTTEGGVSTKSYSRRRACRGMRSTNRTKQYRHLGRTDFLRMERRVPADEDPRRGVVCKPASLARSQPHSPSSSALSRGSMPRCGGCRVDARLKAEHDGGWAGTKSYSRRRVGSDGRHAGGHRRGEPGGDADGSFWWGMTAGRSQYAVHYLSSLIPVLVTGIQPRRVRAVNESNRNGKVSRAQGLGRTGFL
ncbi:hypothetical protein GGI64_005666 [Rhizobium leguminosarum]|uniref:Uncharacterized protein n=1 Tax=Rhizobium leguminosarum TaxID=384 RepID=A0A7Z0J1C1_RHILE|nr:hypothetical protein [Rhizobium leguminosarum]